MADDKLMNIGFDISCKLTSKEMIYMKCQVLFLGKNKKSISKCGLLSIKQELVLTNHRQQMDTTFSYFFFFF